MSRIIIIGNGFDLAHGLKTSYGNLLDFIKQQTNPSNSSLDHYTDHCGSIHHSFRDKINPYITFKYDSSKRDFTFNSCPVNPSIYFKKLFQYFEKYQKWSDLETLYFKLISSNRKIDEVKLINKEFEYLKKLLEYYLYNEIEGKINISNLNLENPFYSRHIIKDRILGVLNFNFTSKVLSYYINNLNNEHPKLIHNNFKLINVHGQLFNATNPIIFGYGDDNSAHYKEIQDREENELLINFKTFQYLSNDNYKMALGLLELEKNIKVEIIGHSCGMTDKTLLKTIFEHPNVSNIEYKYHSESKYYYENIYNMSRIFSDNSLMRKKVIDFRNTSNIPQNKIILGN